MRARSWGSALVLGLLLSGCYKSHALDDTDATAPRDTGTRDTGPLPIDVPRDTPRDAPLDTPPDTPLTSEVCRRDADCSAGLCVLDTRPVPVDLGPAPLVCGVAGGARPGTECDRNGECENGLCAFAGGCVEPCLTDADCPSSDRCVRVPIVTSLDTMQLANACARWIDPSPAVAVTENGTVLVTPFASNNLAMGTAFRSNRLVILMADTYSAERSVDAVSLDGRLVHDGATLGVSPQVNPSIAVFDGASVLVPNGPVPSGINTRGDLRITLTTSAETSMHRVVVEHDGRGTTLDLNVFWLGTRRTTSRRRLVEGMLDGYAPILADLGLRLGRIRHFEATGATIELRALAEDEVDASEMMAYSVGAARPALDVFLIESGATFLGVAGGIPGPIGVHGSGASGVVLALGDLELAIDAGVVDDAFGPVLLAHELGHFNGLFHTSESDGSSYEPLPDTPICDASRDLNGDGMVLSDECFGFGEDNIMFWAALRADARFSDDQGDVLRRSPGLLP